MENQFSSQMKVGIFLTVGLAGMLLTILLLGGEKGLFKSHAKLYVVMDQVQGLNKGSVVSVSGFTVGNVSEMTFSAERKALVVTMKVQEEYLSRITKGSLADIRTQGALGDKYIYITPGDPAAEPLKDGDFLDAAKNTDLMGIISEKGGEATKVFDIINEVYKLTKIINEDGRSEKLIINLVEASQNFKEMSAETKMLLAELRKESPEKLKQALKHFNNVMAKIDRGEGTLGALVNDPALHERLKTIIGADSRKKAIQSLIRSSIEKSD
jgi:phospholipid/cholesterol/gamma-HCH transport system substrate-binding protein